MKQTRSAALSRYTAPDFVLLAGLELMQLRKLSDLAFRVFVESVAMANHVTGEVSTSYAVLLAVCSFDAAPTSPVQSTATAKRVRTALAQLAELRLITDLDHARNEREKRLFFRVPSRVGLSASTNKQGRQQGRPERTKKPTPATTYEAPGGGVGQTVGQGVQEKRLPPSPPLSTAPADPAAARAQLQQTAQALRTRRAAGTLQTAPPRGGEKKPPTGGTPPHCFGEGRAADLDTPRDDPRKAPKRAVEAFFMPGAP